MKCQRGMVAYFCNSSTWKVRQEDQELKASLHYRLRPASSEKEKEIVKCQPSFYNSLAFSLPLKDR